MVILAFLIFTCLRVFNQEYSLQTSLLKRDLSKDTTTYNLTLKNFDMAFRLDSSLREIEP
jgi:hypothetical protein